MRLASRIPHICVWTLLHACGSASGESTGSDPSTDPATTTDPGTGDPPTTTNATTTTDASTTDASTTDASTTTEPDPTTDASTTAEPDPPAPALLHILDDVIFYDGYAATVDEPLPDGVLRHNNALLAVQLTDDQLAAIQNTLQIGVIVGALCDNYDRIGSVNLALVPRGQPTYLPADVQRIELARFITPFMNMNKAPTTVPYQYQADNLVPILKDPELRAAYDFWFELAIFGVPYAANKEIAGCADRNDTQRGTLLLQTDSARAPQTFATLLPLAISQPFNNYADGASDAPGLTRKTLTFTLPADTDNAQLVLITSNHGANAGGEEYIRRQHYVGVDNKLVLQYQPGRPTCEPFRKYNTQGNGIYGPSPKSDAEWQSFSNWCPGDIIDTRVIALGPRSAGDHEFVIEVPDATFAGAQGDFPFSLYVQAE